MPARRTKDSLNTELAKFGCEIIGVYKNLNSTTSFRCACGNIFEQKPYLVLKGSFCACNDCYYNSTVEKLKKFNIAILTPQEEYYGEFSECLFQCHCGNQFKTNTRFLLNYTRNYPSCGCSISKKNFNLKGKKIKKLLVISNLCYRLRSKGQLYNRCLCECGKMTDARVDRLLKGKVFGCRECLFREIAPNPCGHVEPGQKFGRLITLTTEIREKLSNRLIVICRCDCGQKYRTTLPNLIYRRTLACTECQKQDDFCKRSERSDLKINSFLSEMGFKRVFPCNLRDRKIEFQCSCGKRTSRTRSFIRSLIKTKQKFYCKCKLIINGKKTSSIAISIQELIGHGINNFESKYGNIDIALVFKGKKVAIEYDEWFWHKNNESRDKRKSKKLIDGGWYVLRIRASNHIPTKQKLMNSLEKLINSKGRFLAITHKSWGGYLEEFGESHVVL